MTEPPKIQKKTLAQGNRTTPRTIGVKQKAYYEKYDAIETSLIR
ncbi:hypothetical protein HDEF_2162 [Candidatus Hamiltonella defensa 5AT (Acyrthosiphon pisum)]|uniref:Uncharacterized protein n=1 Tax=Hamiltonella defensa subsp. Acyrthosiphon pisum (strain 5AT) TaxID=572265 RepID=C4K865_HAMD5|nr:hypothetical protein HDEF_2162 [Candidatus Hamiltonella defensa 5AT (Acyrthosiphon pisum)]